MKPRICEILGVEVGEKFMLNGLLFEFFINDSGRIFFCDAAGKQPSGDQICDLINGKYRIIRKPNITDEEREILKSAKTFIHAEYIARDLDGTLYAFEKKPIRKKEIWNEDGWCINFPFHNDKFQYIQWSDQEPTKIIDLLNER